MTPSLALALSLLAAAPAPDELVAKAGALEVEVEERLKNEPCIMTVVATELDKKGASIGVTEIVLRQLVKDGKRTDELVRYLDNGKDVTEQKRKKKQEQQKDQEEDGAADEEIRSPFHPKESASYVFEDLGSAAADPALRRIRFVPKKGAKGDRLTTGEALVAADGRVRELRSKPADMPTLVQRMDMSFFFDEHGEIARLEMAGEVGALFMKRRLKMVSTFAWRQTEPPEPAATPKP